MAYYFQLLDKKTNQPIELTKVDEDICRKVYKCEPHHKFWGGEVFNWYDSIGFQLATGLKLEDGPNGVRNYYNKAWSQEEELPLINKVITFMQKNYKVKNGYCR